MNTEEALKIAEATKSELYPPTNVIVLAEALKLVASDKGFSSAEVKNIVAWLSELLHVEPLKRY